MTENQRTRLQQQKELFLERFESMNLQQQLPIVQIIKLYESMNPKGQQKLMEYAQDMLSLPRYKKGIIPLPVGLGTESSGQQSIPQPASRSVYKSTTIQKGSERT